MTFITNIVQDETNVMNKYVVIVELGEDYYQSGTQRCIDIESAINLACNDYHYTYEQIVSVVRIDARYGIS